MDDKIDAIISFFKNLVKPENITLTSFLGLIPLIMYLLNRKTIPKLALMDYGKNLIVREIITCYYIKVKRNKGEGKVEGVEGIVGIKDKELKPSEWLKSKSEIANIMNYDYLLIFEKFYHKENEIIFFPENIFENFPSHMKIISLINIKKKH